MLILLDCLSKLSVFCLTFGIAYFIIKFILKLVKLDDIIVLKKFYLDDIIICVTSLILIVNFISINSIYI